MALRTHEIPVLVQLRPVQGIVAGDGVVRVEMKPALTALLFRPRVPGDGEGLDAAVREFDQILLQRIDAEGVFHLEGRELAVGPIGLDQELAFLTEEARAGAGVVERRVVEIAPHGLRRRVIHGAAVLRGPPEPCFRFVTASTGFAPDEGPFGRH
ncbi:hypothetical protein [Bradyrhizobium sp.]|uniref:hypothetical protein n=1 Tax=Bradyrhizobium sp. TaxID=376 RepID=UPI0029C0C8CF|nr:hypothetical protein [Bradyrhizobium sp.]